MSRAFDEVADTIGSVVALVLTALVFAFLIALLLAGFAAFRYIFSRSGAQGEVAPPAPTTMFGAPAPVRILAAYDYWLYRLEQTTGIEWSTTPTRILIGCVLVSAGPALMVGATVDFVAASPSSSATIALAITGVVVGVVTATQMSKSAAGWFEMGDADVTIYPAEPEDGVIRLGEDVEKW